MGIETKCEDGCQRRNGSQQRKSNGRSKQRHELQRGEHGQVQHAKPTADHRHRIGAPSHAQTSADGDHGRTDQRDSRKLSLHGEGEIFGKVRQQKGDAEKQDDDADANDGVAAGEPRPNWVEASGAGRRDGHRRCARAGWRASASLAYRKWQRCRH